MDFRIGCINIGSHPHQMDFKIFPARKCCICVTWFVRHANKYLHYYIHIMISKLYIHKRHRSETLNMSVFVSNFQFHFRFNENCSNIIAHCINHTQINVNRSNVNMTCIKIVVWCWMSNGKLKTVEHKMKTLKQIFGMRNMPNNHTSVVFSAQYYRPGPE